MLGLDDFRKDALATALHVYYLNRKYPHAELSLSCPRLRPIINNDKINPRDVGEKQLCQVLCAYRLFLPYVGITVSSRESAQFRNGITRYAQPRYLPGFQQVLATMNLNIQEKKMVMPEMNSLKSMITVHLTECIRIWRMAGFSQS